jgi:hypothetical protein
MDGTSNSMPVYSNVAETRARKAGRSGYGRPKTAKARRAIALDEATIAVLRAHRRAQAEDLTGRGADAMDVPPSV